MKPLPPLPWEEEESPLPWEMTPLPPLPHYTKNTWSPHNRWHMSNIITVANQQGIFILLTC